MIRKHVIQQWKILIVIIMIVSINLVQHGQSTEIVTGKIIYVDDDNTDGPWDGTHPYPFQQIQEGIDNAIEGDTIYVFSGVYYERICVEKRLKLVGENRESTIIIGKGENLNSKAIVYFLRSGIEFQGFTVKKDRPHEYDWYGILAGAGDNHLIHDNIFDDNFHGIRFDGVPYRACKSFNNSIYNNLFINNKEGIRLDGWCEKFSIYNNEFIDNHFAIETNSEKWGFIKYHHIYQNSFQFNEVAVRLGKTTYSLIRKNNFHFNFINVYSDSWTNIFFRNYWNRPRLAPKLIFGYEDYKSILQFDLINGIDLRPALIPNHI